MKKLIALLLLTLMVFSLSANAFADTAETGTITISNTTIGETYTLYKIFDATIDATNNPVSIAYTYSGTLDENNYFSQDEAGYIRIKSAGKDSSGHLTKEAVTFLGTIKGTADDTKLADANTVVFSNVPYGYYYIESTLGNKAVSVDSTTPNAILIDKNQGPSWVDPEKTGDAAQLGKYILEGTDPNVQKLTANSVNFGDKVKFEVSFNATNYVKEEKVLTYFLNDTIAAGFEIDKSTLKVFFDGVEKTVTTDYTVTYSSDNKTFTVAAPWVDATGTLKNHANVVFKVTYEATLLNTAVLASTGNKNTAYFDYRLGTDSSKATDPANPDSPPTSPYHKSDDKETVTYTYAVGITKIDGTDKHVLKGAEFTLSKKDGTVIKAKATSTAGVYEYSTGTDAVAQFATDDNGVLIIKGLAEGTYTLKEAVAPKGYNRAVAGVDFIFERDKKDTYVTIHTVDSVEYKYSVNVIPVIFANERGVALPITGGMGTTIFYIIGGALVFGAVLLLITKKRMSEK